MAHRKKLRLWTLASLVLGTALLVLTFCAGRASALPQPNLEAALSHLEQARAALEKATDNKGGFRGKALGLTNEAIAVVREGIASGNK